MKYRAYQIGILLLSMFIFSSKINADDLNTGISIASGHGDCSIIPIRVGLQRDFGHKLRPESTFPLGGYWEGSLYYMHGKAAKNPGSHKSLFAAAAAGVLRFEKREKTCLGWPYLDAGIGLSLLSRKEIGGKQLGINFQFEDRVGLGIRFGENRQYDLGYRLVHFSNASIAKHNSGINLHLLVFSYWF